jgi:hypothetical protein
VLRARLADLQRGVLDVNNHGRVQWY